MRKKKSRWTSAAARRIIQLASNAPTVEDAVEITASRLLDGVPCPPTDLDVLKDRVNVKAIQPVPSLPVSGELRVDGDGFLIVYSASMSRGRQRFTIAHELGHAALQSTGPNCPRYGRELERICNMLASEFLMPRSVFEEGLGPTIHPGQIYKLARDFDTSIMATALRCLHLLGISIFQVENARVVWGYGAIRQQRDFQAEGDAFRTAITRAMRGDAGEQSVFIKRRNHKLRWACVPGQHRALFVLQPENGLAKDNLGKTSALQ